MKHATLVLVGSLVLSSVQAFGQCQLVQVAHLSGSQAVGGSDVTVTSAGVVSSNTTYCTETYPYFIGYNGGSATGSYTFVFDPPIDTATLNFSGISQTGPIAEEVKLIVNGVHYAIPQAGDPNICDPMAVLTPNGDVGACSECSVSGWAGTGLSGPISTLTVVDTVLSGAPQGSIFSLFVCAGSAGVHGISNTGQAAPYPNPANGVVYIDAQGAAHTEVSLFDVSGRRVASAMATATDRLALPTTGLAHGLYTLTIERDRTRSTHRVVVG